MRRQNVSSLRRAAGSATAVALALGASVVFAQAPTVVHLTQTGCQFLESENNIDHAFQTQRAQDCEAINARTGQQRLNKAKVLMLKPGNYIFRVANRNVPYELGFWLRSASALKRSFSPSVSGGGLLPGKVQDYAITLTAGDYVYSCPLNPTPDYVLQVR